ncbi:MAG: LysE family transporter [Candidatus Latescibacteria bacterium]|nr:LysE family transporter [Candidatus Latescibacterota bacterium]
MFLFLIQAVVISLTGVMAPGPITAVTVGTGTRSPHAGALVAVGHGIVEFPLMALIYYGLGDFFRIGAVRAATFALGGLFLLFMGYDMLRSIKKAARLHNGGSRKPLVAGILLSMGNAYFLIWWATVGASLISKAVAFGIAGVMTFAVVHWFCDLIWFYILSIASYKGGRVFGARFQKTVFAVCGVFLLFFGALFIRDAAGVLAG